MTTRSTPALGLWPAGIAAALLALSAGSAQARVDLSIGLNLPLFIGGYNGAPAYGSVYGGLPAGAVSVQIGGGRYWRHGGHYYRPWGPRWMIVAPPVVLAAPVYTQTLPDAAPPLPPQPSRPDPVIYPRNGQSAEQTEFDRQDCNRWATTQPAALADAGVFHRAVEACMDGRGYSMK
ncbi:MAG: hypothetical protein Q8K45_00555 [Rubrivivax sp.]|nr:hypothetical protein [Rubrivivax sp.]